VTYCNIGEGIHAACALCQGRSYNMPGRTGCQQAVPRHGKRHYPPTKLNSASARYWMRQFSTPSIWFGRYCFNRFCFVIYIYKCSRPSLSLRAWILFSTAIAWKCLEALSNLLIPLRCSSTYIHPENFTHDCQSIAQWVVMRCSWLMNFETLDHTFTTCENSFWSPKPQARVTQIPNCTRGAWDC